MKPTRTLADRLWARIRQTPSGCWEWTGTTVTGGYGRIRKDRQTKVLAHRAAWEVTHGPIPDGMLVRHRCDNPPCCNPDHLQLGTHDDNMRDRTERGRLTPFRGANVGTAKLTERDVRAIRSAADRGTPAVDLAAAFGVTKENIRLIVTRRTWKDVA